MANANADAIAYLQLTDASGVTQRLVGDNRGPLNLPMGGSLQWAHNNGHGFSSLTTVRVQEGILNDRKTHPLADNAKGTPVGEPVPVPAGKNWYLYLRKGAAPSSKPDCAICDRGISLADVVSVPPVQQAHSAKTSHSV